ncbi:MAG TPA: hypothetical protein VNA20_13385 [Frankiaceae bacterium]|nr:hypothetical protein [Frankiaceae bacterium]
MPRDASAANAASDAGERRWGADEIGVVAAGLTFVVLASLPWFVATLGPDERATFRAWDLGVLTLLCVLLSVYATGRVVWLHFRPLGPEVPLAPGVEPFVAALAALALMLYRSMDVPTVPLAANVQRTIWLIAALFTVTFQVVFALRAVARTGFRA